MIRNKKNIILIGGGGHCKSCIDVIESTEKYHIVGILDLPSQLGKKVLNYEIIGNDDDYLKFKDQNCSFLITAGQIKSAELRIKIYEKLKRINAKIETIISSKATVSKYAVIGEGTIIMHHAIINAGATVKENCIINSGSIIEHDVIIGKHTHISTSAVINGDCKVGQNSFVGSNSCISNNIKITDNVTIGAGSTVIKNISDSGVYIGSPAKKIKDE